MATLWMYIHNVESGIHNVDNTIHNVAPPKKEKVQNIASDIMNGDIYAFTSSILIFIDWPTQ